MIHLRVVPCDKFARNGTGNQAVRTAVGSEEITAADKSDVHLHLVNRQLKKFGEGFARAERILQRAHHLAFAIANDCSRNQRLHGCLSKVRLIIFGRYSFGCAGERLVEISLIPLDVTRHVRDFSHLPSKRGGVVAAILTVFPVELEGC